MLFRQRLQTLVNASNARAPFALREQCDTLRDRTGRRSRSARLLVGSTADWRRKRKQVPTVTRCRDSIEKALIVVQHR